MGEIVVGVDGSPAAAAALTWSVREGELRGWKVTALRAWGYVDDGNVPRGPEGESRHQHELLAAAAADAIGDRAASAVSLRAVCDEPARALLRAAAGAELLVVGPRGLGAVRGLLLGSVTEKCIQRSPRPVAVVHGRPGTATHHSERIVVAMDGSDAAQGALQWAVDAGRAREAIVSPVYATKAEAILEAAEKADLVVVGSRRRGSFSGLLVRSVSDQVVRRAHCPVVVVRVTSDRG